MKYTGAADYDQPLHRDYLNHRMVPADDPRFRQLEMFVYLVDVPGELGPPGMLSRTRTTGCPRSRTGTRAKAPPTPKEAGSRPPEARIFTMLRSAPPGRRARSSPGRREPSIAAPP